MLQRLEAELSPKLVYHGVSHTSEDVVPAVERLAAMEGIQGDALSLLLTAAWYHDLGFIEGPQNHELTGARIARQVLPGYRQGKGKNCFAFIEMQFEILLN